MRKFSFRNDYVEKHVLPVYSLTDFKYTFKFAYINIKLFFLYSITFFLMISGSFSSSTQ